MFKKILDYILLSLPLLVIIGSVIAFSGDAYIKNIAEEVWEEKALVNPQIATIKTELVLIKALLEGENVSADRIEKHVIRVEAKLDELTIILTRPST